MSIILKKEYEKPFLFWLIILIALLIIMIAVGGLTRLTDSGLSITQWEHIRYSREIPNLSPDFLLFRTSLSISIKNCNYRAEYNSNHRAVKLYNPFCKKP